MKPTNHLPLLAIMLQVVFVCIVTVIIHYLANDEDDGESLWRPQTQITFLSFNKKSTARPLGVKKTDSTAPGDDVIQWSTSVIGQRLLLRGTHYVLQEVYGANGDDGVCDGQ